MDKIAFLILAHNDPQHLKKLIYALDYPAFDIYVHVDAKADIEQFGFDKYELKHSELFVLDDRVKVYWADYSIVQATINMYRRALENYDYSRYVTLSGNDYPLQSNSRIYQELSDPKVEFIMGTPSEKPEKTRYYYFKKTGIIGKLFTHLFRWLRIVKNKNGLTLDGKTYTIYFAPQWHALSGDCVRAILEIISTHEQEIYEYFKHSFAPDELLIPTILFNDESFRKKALRAEFPKGTHYNEMPAIHYINYEPVVQVFTEQDAEKLLTSGKLFARKLLSGVSDGLVRIIDEARKQ